MLRTLIVVSIAAVLATPALAQEAPADPPQMMTLERPLTESEKAAFSEPQPNCDVIKNVPQTKLSVMIVPTKPDPLRLQYTSAMACEKERCRIKTFGIGSVCIWVN